MNSFDYWAGMVVGALIGWALTVMFYTSKAV